MNIYDPVKERCTYENTNSHYWEVLIDDISYDCYQSAISHTRTIPFGKTKNSLKNWCTLNLDQNSNPDTDPYPNDFQSDDNGGSNEESYIINEN